MLRRDSPTPREHMSERLWMRDRMALLHSVCHHHEFVKTSHRGSHETCSPQVLTGPSITAAPPNLEVIMSYIILFDRQFVPLSGPNSRRTRTEHVQNEGCFFGEKGTCSCNASRTALQPFGRTGLETSHNNMVKICP